MQLKRDGVATLLLLAMAVAGADETPLATIQIEKMATMTEEAVRVENFRHIERIFPVKTVHRAGAPFQFKSAPQDVLQVPYTWNGVESTAGAFLEKTVTTNFLVVKNDAIAAEHYFLGNDAQSKATSMSVAKSFTSALIGIAIAEGHIKSVNDPVDQYVPELAASGYKGVPIKHLLQMSSGIKFSEVYDDQTSDIITMLMQCGMGVSIVDYAAGLQAEKPSGKEFNYASIDTNVLGMVLERATGVSPAVYLEEKIWKPLGMESDAHWGTDNHGNVLTFAWLNVTARDYAKFGRLYLNQGNWDGRIIVPPAWVHASLKPDQEYLKLKDHLEPGWDIGYQYQWWAPAGTQGEFTGIGVWGQYLYVNPALDVIIVKNSVDPDFDTRDRETVAVFRAVAHHLK
ncbi:MAG: serine hydrolase [Candidatus Hydrogenedentes bacterium]|nr:serine hydrolase [Candidatus Hydrogenedentota bacterium]